MQRHAQFRPKINGKWFAYYQHDDSEKPITEFIYIEQIADKVSGTITNSINEAYEFSGQLVLGTLVLTWISQDEEYDVAGSMVLDRYLRVSGVAYKLADMVLETCIIKLEK